MNDQLSDGRIVDSWHKNASPWTDAVRGNQIESRTLVTNRAIIEAVLSRAPRTVLDIGCGEGWLVRALAEHGVCPLDKRGDQLHPTHDSGAIPVRKRTDNRRRRCRRGRQPSARFPSERPVESPPV